MPLLDAAIQCRCSIPPLLDATAIDDAARLSPGHSALDRAAHRRVRVASQSQPADRIIDATADCSLCILGCPRACPVLRARAVLCTHQVTTAVSNQLILNLSLSHYAHESTHILSYYLSNTGSQLYERASPVGRTVGAPGQGDYGIQRYYSPLLYTITGRGRGYSCKVIGVSAVSCIRTAVGTLRSQLSFSDRRAESARRSAIGAQRSSCRLVFTLHACDCSSIYKRVPL